MSKADVNTVRSRVQGMLTQIGNVTLDSDGDYSFGNGSTRVFIRVTELDAFSIVNVYAPVLRAVVLTPDVYKYVAEVSDSYTFGHVVLRTDEDGAGSLYFVHRVLADYLDLEELQRSVLAVASTADELDDQLMARFGGKRFIDP